MMARNNQARVFLRHLVLALIYIVPHVRASSLTFVIDDSGSMKDDIEQVRRGANLIMNSILDRKASQIDDIVVVTFSDPEDQVFVKKSKIREEVKSHMSKIYAHNDPRNLDWPESSLTGTKRALEESSPGSYLFVFSDASATDYKKADAVIELCQRKQSQVVFILTDYCPSWYEKKWECSVYYDVAKACSGQVFQINKDEVEQVVKTVIINTKDQGSEVVKVDVPPNVRTKVPFKIDGKTEQAVVYATGIGVSLDVDDPHSTKDFWSPNVKVVNMKNLTPGNYSATVKGSSTTTVTVIAKTNFLFEHGFSELQPQSLNDTSKQPIEGKKSHLSVLVQDPDHSVEIKSVELVNMQERVIEEERPLRRVSGDFYTTDQFVPPSTMFKIRVKGITYRENITRTAKTPVQPTKETEAAKTIKYGERATIRCEIKSSMSLQIKWFLNNTNILERSDKYSISSNGAELNIKFMDLDLVGRYTCKASLLSVPHETAAYNTNVQITGLAAPEIIRKYPKVITTQSKQPITIACSVQKGAPKPQISWQFKQRLSDMFRTISGSGANLRIPSAALHDAGYYKCEAKNAVGHDDYITELIVNMAPELTIDEGTEKEIAYNGGLTLTCRVSAYPEAHIEWRDDKGTVMPTITQRYSGAYKTQDMGTMKLINMRKSNKYSCHAANSQGATSKSITVTVRSAFTVGVHPEAETKIEYGKAKSIRCDIKSLLPMKIDWLVNNTKLVKQSNNYFISADGTELKIKYMDLDQVGKYTCRASLLSDPEEDKDYDTNVKITGLVSPKINKDLTPPVIRTDARKYVSITCSVIKGTPMPKISWQFKARHSNKFLPIAESADVLRITSAELPNSGHYRCVAENEVGRDNYTTELIVSMAPEVTIDEGTEKEIAYNGGLTLTCRVSAYPEANIVWSDDKENMPTITQRYTGAYKTQDLGTINLANMRKSKKYSCHAANSQGATSKSITVTVRSAFTVGVRPKAETKIEYGKAKSIRCDIKSSLPMKIDWLVNNTKLVKQSNNYFISADGTELKITNMDLDQVGKYTCRASLLSDPEKDKVYDINVKITGLIAPKVYKGMPSITAKVNTSVKISCKVLQGVPKPKISWAFKSTNSEIFVPYMGSTGEEIHIANAKLTDSGHYMCAVENVEGVDSKISELVVEAPPTIASNDYVEAVEGDIVLRIDCNATGYPKPVVTWRVKGKPIIPDEKYSIEDHVLVIKRPNENDAQKYICEANNYLGSATQPFEVVVTSDVDYSKNKSYVFVNKRVSKNLNCLLPHTESDSIRWYLNGQLINATGWYLQLNNASVYKDGNYTCRVSNNLGSKSETYVVHFGFPPMFTVAQKNINIDWFQERLLDCAVDAKPKPNAKWFYNGKAIETAANQLQQDIIGWGHYTCRISNVHGSVERSFNVTSENCIINRNTESVANAPLLLSESSAWPQFEINNDFISVPSKEKLKLSCRGDDGNVFQKFNNKREIDVTCVHESFFMVDENLHKYSELRCAQHVMPAVVQTGKICLHEDTEMMRVGFNAKDFLDVYEVCFDKRNNVTLYTRINMSSTRKSNRVYDEKWYEYPGLRGGNTPSVYACKNPSSTCCYAKHQLVNADDVNFGPSRGSTFIDNLNAVPYWRSCDGSNRTTLEAIENIISLEMDAYPEISVWSGASSFNNFAGRNIPRYIWKIIKLDEDAATAVVYVNDPNPVDSDLLCTNICDVNAGLWIQSSDKFTYCCELEDFLTAFGLPQSITEDV